MISTQRLLLGACLLAGRAGAFHVPVASSLSGHARSTLAGAAGNPVAVSVHRRVHSAGVLMATAPSGQMQETIEGRLMQALSPVHLEVINESHMHAGPAKESHFKVRKGLSGVGWSFGSFATAVPKVHEPTTAVCASVHIPAAATCHMHNELT